MSFNLKDLLALVGDIVSHANDTGALADITHGKGGLHKDVAIAGVVLSTIATVAPLFGGPGAAIGTAAGVGEQLLEGASGAQPQPANTDEAVKAAA